jgi:hypothetical protein
LAHGTLALLLATALLMALTGCRENEQNRPLDFKPHVYQGERTPALTEQQKRDLQERGNLQK